MKGIVTVACGYIEYLKMAENLGQSLKINGFNNFAIITDLDVSSEFSLIKINKSDLMVNKVYQPQFAKTLLYDLTPYKETIFLDADTIIFTGKNVDTFFNQNEEIVFQKKGQTSKENETKKYTCWVNKYELNSYFKNPNWVVPHFSSEFIYFKKTETVKKYFKKVKSIYVNFPFQTLNFNGGLPDEAAFNIAWTLIFSGVPEDKTFFFWAQTEKKQPINLIVNNYIGLSIGGNNEIPNQYNEILKYLNYRGFKTNKVFPKRQWNNKRRSF